MTQLEKERYQRLKDQSKREHKWVLAAMRRFKNDGDALKWLASAESGADTRSTVPKMVLACWPGRLVGERSEDSGFANGRSAPRTPRKIPGAKDGPQP